MLLFVDNFWFIFVATVLSLVLFTFLLVKNKKGGAPLRRRTSLASMVGIDRKSMEKHLALRQNVVNALLWFERGDAPFREEMVAIMQRLAPRFERLRSQPVMVPNGRACEWVPINDLNAAVERAVTEDPITWEKDGNDVELERTILEKVGKYKAEILPTDPAWRVVILPPSAVLVRIDHCIGDGLTLVTLLREIGTSINGDRSLKLADLSPLLRHFEIMGDWMVSLLPFTLLWPPRLLRAVSFLTSSMHGPEEHFNPLRPAQEHLMNVIPAEKYGTVYFPTVPLFLFKELAHAAGSGTTINDVVLFCLADAIREYFRQVGSEQHKSIRLLLPIANPIRPSLYGDEFEGLCNHMTPVIVPLDVSENLRVNPHQALGEIKECITRVKQSNTPLFMTTLNTLFDRYIPMEKVFSSAEAAFKRVSCVYSNVPGPTQAISIADRRVRKIQVIMPHPTSIFQVLSYDGNIFFNITLDTRSAQKAWLLRDTFVQAIRNFATNWGALEAVQDDIDACACSREWGGRGIVYACSSS